MLYAILLSCALASTPRQEAIRRDIREVVTAPNEADGFVLTSDTPLEGKTRLIIVDHDEMVTLLKDAQANADFIARQWPEWTRWVLPLIAGVVSLSIGIGLGLMIGSKP